MGQGQGCLGKGDAGGAAQNSESLLRSSAEQAGYELKKWLGAGSTGEVWLAEEAATSKSFALKFIKLDGCAMTNWKTDERGALQLKLDPSSWRALVRETQCSVELGEAHVNIVRPHELLLTTTHLVLATEYSAGGSLQDYCLAHPCVNEATAQYFFLQLVAALTHCHRKGIAYRDVKPANALLDGSDPPILQLCDFGAARRVRDHNGNVDFTKMHSFTGTQGFLAPQVVAVGACKCSKAPVVPYDGAKADVYAAGVVLFILLSCLLPFDPSEAPPNEPAAPPTAAGAAAASAATAPSFVDRLAPPARAAAQGFSPEVRDLLEKMLHPSEACRISMDAVGQHEWCRRPLPAPYAAQLSKIEAVQAARDKAAARAPKRYCCPDGDRLIEEMIEGAMSVALGKAPPGPPRLLSRLPLEWKSMPCEAQQQGPQTRYLVPSFPAATPWSHLEPLIEYHI